MEQPQTEIHNEAPPALLTDLPAAPAAARSVLPQACASCGAVANTGAGTSATPAWVYALGNIEPRFPRLAVEKEFAQIVARETGAGLTDRQLRHMVLSRPENRYLLRQVCFVMSVEGLETYILTPRDPSDLSLLAGAVRPDPSPTDLDVVIGMKGPIAPPQMCNGLMVPVVAFDQIYSFDRDALIKAIPKPADMDVQRFEAASAELLDRILLMADNAGAIDEHRALNYLAVRYQAIYSKAAELFAQNSSLTAVDVQTSALSGLRKVLDVVFSYTNRGTDVVEKWFVRADVTEEFPFLVTKLSPYYGR